MKEFEDWAEKTVNTLKDALYQCAQEVEAESVKRCPQDTGQLRANHDVIVDKSDDFSVIVTYESNVPKEQQYGLYVHECPNSKIAYANNVALNRFRRNNPNRGIPWDTGEDHFLKNALDANQTKIKKRLIEAMKECCK